MSMTIFLIGAHFLNWQGQKKNQVVNPCQLFFTFMEVFSMKFSNAHLLKNNVHVSLYLFFLDNFFKLANIKLVSL